MKQAPDILQDFAQSLASRNPKTTTTYLSVLRHLIAWLALQPGGTPFQPTLLTPTVIQGYLDHLQASGRAPRTRRKALTAISRFCRWAITQDLLQRNPISMIEPPTVVLTAPRELSDTQRFILKNRVDLAYSFRLSAIFALGYWTGLRVSEISHLRLDQCQLNQRAGAIVVADSKGGKSRTLDLHNFTRRALLDYINQAPDSKETRDPDSLFLFTSQRAAWLRRQDKVDYLSPRGIEYLWHNLKHQAPIDQWQHIHDIRFHDLRHDWAHRARAVGWSLEEIAVYLGHQTKDGIPAIASTVRYTLPSRQQLKLKLQILSG